MFFRKEEPKKINICATLIVATLASVGAMTIISKGKEICTCLGTKFKGMINQLEIDGASGEECE